MQHIVDSQQVVRIGFLELLNDLSLNIVHIDNTYYAFTEFIPIDEHANEITVVGKNITSIVENTTQTVGANELQKREIIGRIDAMKIRRRVFAPGTPYVKYIYG